MAHLNQQPASGAEVSSSNRVSGSAYVYTARPVGPRTSGSLAGNAGVANANRAGGSEVRDPCAHGAAQVGKNASTELAPVCAIMGGMVAAEVIKIISGKDAPINNLFLFDAATTSGEARHPSQEGDEPQPASAP
eukprot:scaffold644_cov126-Isochrysis_galbana.AAC.9